MAGSQQGWRSVGSGGGGGGSVISVTASAPVVSSGGANPNISMAKADSTTNGYLSASDWTAFNNKLSSAFNQQIQDEGNNVPQRNVINFVGNGVSVTDTGGKTQVSITSGQGNSIYYLNLSVSESPYSQFSSNPVSGSQQSVTANISGSSTSTIASFQTPIGIPNTTNLIGGLWSFFLHFGTSSSSTDFTIYVEVYKRTNAGVETLILTTDSFTTSTLSSTPVMILTDGVLPNTTLLTTDRIVVKVVVVNNNPSSHNITFYTEGTTNYSVSYTTLGQSIPSGAVTNVTASSPLTSSGGTTPNLAIPQANGSTNGFLSLGDWTTFNNKQNALVNPVTGTGASGQVSFWSGTNTQSGSNNFFWDNTNGRLGIGTSTPDSPLNITSSNSASGGVGRIVNIASTLTASANNDTLVAFDINPTFTNGAFTGVSNVALRVTGNSTFAGTTRITSGSNYIQTDANSGSAPFLSLFYASVIDARIYAQNTITLGAASMGTGIASYNAGSINYGSITGSKLGATNGVIAVSNTGADAYMHIASPSGFSNFLYFRESGIADRGVVGYANGTSYMQIRTNAATNMTNGTLSTAFFASGNVGINTTTDAGFKLDVNGTARVQGNLTVTGNNINLPAVTGVYGSSQISGVYNSGGSQGYVALGFSSNFTNSIGLYVFQNVNNPQFVFGRPTLVQPSNIKFEITGSQTAPALGTLAVGTSISNTLEASANNQTLVGLDVAPTFTTGAFTGITNTALRVTGDVSFGSNFIWNNANGNLALGGTASSTDRLYVKATTTSPSDFAIRVQDSLAATNLFTINNAGSLVMRNRSFTGEFTLGFGANNTLNFGLTAIGTFMTVGTTTPSNVVTFGVQQIQSNVRGALFASTEIGVPNVVTINGIPPSTSGTTPLNSLLINPAINNTGTYVGTVRGLYYNPTLTSLTGTTHRAIETAVGDVIFNSTSGNVAIGGTSFGTSANRVLAVYNGTAPASSPLDTFQMYSADIVGGNAAPHFRTENGTTIKLYQETAVTTAQGIATALTNLGVLATSTIPQSGYTLIFGHSSATFLANNTYDIGALTYLPPTNATSNSISRRFKVPKTGIVKKVSILTVCGNQSSLSPSPTLRLNNFTTSTITTITTFNLYNNGGAGAFARNEVFSPTGGIAVTEGNEINIQSVIPNWTTAPQIDSFIVTLWIEET